MTQCPRLSSGTCCDKIVISLHEKIARRNICEFSAIPNGNSNRLRVFCRLGRKRTFLFFATFCAVFLLVIVVVEELYGLDAFPTLITILIFLARFGCGAAWGVIYCFTAESFPTVVRSTSIGMCTVGAYVGGTVAPFLAFVGICKFSELENMQERDPKHYQINHIFFYFSVACRPLFYFRRSLGHCGFCLLSPC